MKTCCSVSGCVWENLPKHQWISWEREKKKKEKASEKENGVGGLESNFRPGCLVADTSSFVTPAFYAWI